MAVGIAERGVPEALGGVCAGEKERRSAQNNGLR